MYKLTIEEVTPKANFPYSQLLQLRWRSPVYPLAKTHITKLLRKYDKGKIDFPDLYCQIYMYIAKLRTEHPKEFPEPGWWDKKNAKIATRDRISPTSKLTKLSKQVNICKICGGYLAEIKYYTAVQIEGEYWVVHKKCIKAYSDEIEG